MVIIMNIIKHCLILIVLVTTLHTHLYAHQANKTILITASTGAFGEAISTLLASEGYNLVIAGRNSNKLTTLQKKLQTKHKDVSVQTVIIDFSNVESIEAAANQVQQLHGIVLIGPRPSLKKEDIPSKEEWNKTFNETFINPLEVLRHFNPKIADKSSIVIISGNTSKNYFPQFPNTNVIRVAWVAEVKNLIYFFAKRHIRVNLVSPGIILTEHHKKVIQQKAITHNISFKEQLAKDVSSIPLKTYGTTEDVAQLVSFLLSNRSKHLNGANITLDGGESTSY